jgi:hypothetical protein
MIVESVLGGCHSRMRFFRRSAMRLVFEADGTRKPADRSAGFLIRNLIPAYLSPYDHSDGHSHRRIGDTLARILYGTLRGSRCYQSGSAVSQTD